MRDQREEPVGQLLDGRTRRLGPGGATTAALGRTAAQHCGELVQYIETLRNGMLAQLAKRQPLRIVAELDQLLVDHLLREDELDQIANAWMITPNSDPALPSRETVEDNTEEWLLQVNGESALHSMWVPTAAITGQHAKARLKSVVGVASKCCLSLLLQALVEARV